MFHVIQEPLLTSQDYLNEYREKHQNDAYSHMLEQRSQLPVFQYKTALIDAVKRSRVIVVKGATGCGKTTQVCRIVLIAHLDLILVYFFCNIPFTYTRPYFGNAPFSLYLTCSTLSAYLYHLFVLPFGFWCVPSTLQNSYLDNAKSVNLWCVAAFQHTCLSFVCYLLVAELPQAPFSIPS